MMTRYYIRITPSFTEESLRGASAKMFFPSSRMHQLQNTRERLKDVQGLDASNNQENVCAFVKFLYKAK